MPNHVIVVAGQSGCGKDYLVERANVPPHAINQAGWGQLFASIVGEHRDHLTYAPDDPRTLKIQHMVTRQVLNLQPVIVTSHPVKIENGVEYVNWEIDKQLSPLQYLFVTSPAELIDERVARRAEATGRSYPRLTLPQIRTHQARKLVLVEALSKHVGAGFAVIKNEPGAVESSIEQLRQAIEQAQNFSS